MKSTNPIQKYPHIIESYACMNALISFGICSTLKLSKYVTFLAFTYKAIQLVPIDLYMPHPLF